MQSSSTWQPDGDRSLEPGESVCTVNIRDESMRVVLTYDDGPEPAGTEQVLAGLGRAGASATFFVLATRIRLFRSLLLETVDAGHEIALHGLDHQNLASMDPSVAQERTRIAKVELEQAIQQPVVWFRPPYGAQTPATWLAVRSLGLMPVLWSAMLRDWQFITDEERLAGAMATTVSGEILLAHDGFACELDGVDDGPPPPIDRGRLTNLLLDRYGEMGFTACSLGDAMTVGTAVTPVRLDAP
ncbi:MAG: polysaccharide deacetylase family protein [bacterium]|nr:polysaccharide deacetylase family protein [bacterium]